MSSTISPTAGNPFANITDEREFRLNLGMEGQSVLLKQRRTTERCSCWIESQGTYDPDCSCDVGYVLSTIRMKVVWRHDEKSHGLAGSDAISTTVGGSSRRDAYLMVPKIHDQDIKLRDFLWHPADAMPNRDQIEYEIISKVPIYGSRNNIIYLLLIAFKTIARKAIGDYGTDPVL